MTRDEIKDIARTAGVEASDQLQQFAVAVAQAQAQRCARLIWKHRSDWMQHNDWTRCEDACALMARMEMEVRHA